MRHRSAPPRRMASFADALRLGGGALVARHRARGCPGLTAERSRDELRPTGEDGPLACNPSPRERRSDRAGSGARRPPRARYPRQALPAHAGGDAQHQPTGGLSQLQAELRLEREADDAEQAQDDGGTDRRRRGPLQTVEPPLDPPLEVAHLSLRGVGPGRAAATGAAGPAELTLDRRGRRRYVF